jgi:hypothetical protein
VVYHTPNCPNQLNNTFYVKQENQMVIRILSPTGVIGAGFKLTSFKRGLELNPHFIACDAGSTDSGPASLGSGKPKLSREAVKRDLYHLLMGRNQLNIPLIIGSCGTSGRDVGVDWMDEIAREIAQEENIHFKMATIKSDQDPEYLKKRYREGRIKPLFPAPDIDEGTFERSRIVGMMGIEPIVAALEHGVEVVLAGRASDTSLFAAVPHMMGANPGLNWHAAKTIECGAACAVNPGADGLFVHLYEDHYDVEPLDLDNQLTPQSVAAHTLYENSHPFFIPEPSGILCTETAEYEAISNRAVRVSGPLYKPAEKYTIKLEGAEWVGYQTIIIGGIRDAVIIRRLPELIPFAQEYFNNKIKDIFQGKVDPASIDIRYRIYGMDGVMGEFEPLAGEFGHEVGVLITITAPTQELASKIATFVAHVSSHLPIPEYQGLISSIAYPFSPPEIDRGPAYRFSVNHVVEPDDPYEMFRTEYHEVGCI